MEINQGTAESASFTIIPVIGTVDGSNTSFIFSAEPKVITVDNIPKQKVSSDGTINWIGTTNVTLLIAPNFDIFGY